MGNSTSLSVPCPGQVCAVGGTHHLLEAAERGDMMAFSRVLAKAPWALLHHKLVDSNLPVHLAAQRGHLDVLKLIVEAVAQCTADGSTICRSCVSTTNTPDDMSFSSGRGTNVTSSSDHDVSTSSQSMPHNILPDGHYNRPVRRVLPRLTQIRQVLGSHRTGTPPASSPPLGATSPVPDSSVHEGSPAVQQQRGSDVARETQSGTSSLAAWQLVRLAHVQQQVASIIDMPNHKGQTALMFAAWHGHADCVELLMQQGAEPWAVSKTGRTALHYAALGSHANCVDAIMDRLPPEVTTKGEARLIDRRTPRGFTPLMYAVAMRHLPTVQALLRHGPNILLATTDVGTPHEPINMSGCISVTPLHLAARNDDEASAMEILRFYVESGGDQRRDPRRRVSSWGWTPHQTAMSFGHIRLAEVLRPAHVLAHDFSHDEELRFVGVPTLQYIVSGVLRQHLLDTCQAAAAIVASYSMSRACSLAGASLVGSSPPRSPGPLSSAALPALGSLYDVEEDAVPSRQSEGPSNTAPPDQQTSRAWGSSDDGEGIVWPSKRSLERCPPNLLPTNVGEWKPLEQAMEEGLILSSGVSPPGASEGVLCGGMSPTHKGRMFETSNDSVFARSLGRQSSERSRNRSESPPGGRRLAALVSRHSIADPVTMCGVCLDEREVVQLVPCKHRLCAACAEEIVHRMFCHPVPCPFCRTYIGSYVPYTRS